MVAFGMVLVWSGYAVGSWGWCIVRGYNITLREWVSPLHPFDWASGVKCIPPGRLLPKAGVGIACGGSGTAGEAPLTSPSSTSGSSSSGGGLGAAIASGQTGIA